jgi:peptide/nickel transport system substrate-binding protein
LLCAALSLVCPAARHPQYGGTLRVELNAARIALDPRQWQPGSPEAALGQQFAALVFDRLVSLDNYGRFQPQLAVSWNHDPEYTRWQFALRPHVVFSDGSPLTPADVVSALTRTQGKPFLAEGNLVVVQSASAMPDLLEELASGGAFVFRELPGGALAGTGPFVPSQAGTSAGAFAGTLESQTTFVANERAWSGRPFLDAIEVLLSVPPGRQLLDLEMGKADLIELAPDLVHHAEEARLRTWASLGVEVVLLVPEGQSPAAEDVQLRQRLSLAIDRATMAGVLLQRQAQPAASLLPGWLTGYGSLFPSEINPGRAAVPVAVPHNPAGATEPLWLNVDQEDSLMRLLAERVAINARQAGLHVRVASPAVSAALANGSGGGRFHLVRWHISSLAPRAALDSLAAFLKVPDEPSGAADAAPEHVFQHERAILDSGAAIPLVFLPQTLALGSAVRDWMPSPWDAWHLENVWLDRTGSAPQGASP